MSKLYEEITGLIDKIEEPEDVDSTAKAIEKIVINAQIELLKSFLLQIEEVGLYSGDIIRNKIEELQKQLEQ